MIRCTARAGEDPGRRRIRSDELALTVQPRPVLAPRSGRWTTGGTPGALDWPRRGAVRTAERRWPVAKQGVRVIDRDMHLMEPPDLWERYIAPEWRHAAPVGLTELRRDMRVKVK